MSMLTANGSNDDFDPRQFKTYVLQTSDMKRWQMRVEANAPAIQPENAPYN